MSCALSPFLCILAALVICTHAETHIYESDFDTGIPGVSGHSMVVVRNGFSGMTAGSNTLPNPDDMLAWALQQLGTMANMHATSDCENSMPVVLVGGYPMTVDVSDNSFVAPLTSDNAMSWTTDSSFTTPESYSNGYADYSEEGQLPVQSSHKDYQTRRIILVFLMGICAVTLFLCIQQARELKKAMEVSARKAACSAVITSKTPLLGSLPYEGVQDIPVVAVATLK